MDAANPGAMFIERARVNPESSSGPPTAEQTVEARPAGYYPPTTVAPANRRGHVERDLAPIRSNNGLSFADMLARNGGTRPDADARHHPPSPTRVVQFFNFQRSPACAKSFSSKEFPTALTGPAPFNTHTRTLAPTRNSWAPSARRPARSQGPNPYSNRHRTPAPYAEGTLNQSRCAPRPPRIPPRWRPIITLTQERRLTRWTPTSTVKTQPCRVHSHPSKRVRRLSCRTISTRSTACRTSRGESLCATLQRTAAGAMRAHVIDCRYPHEFDGGHVRGAVNIHDPAALQRYLCALLAEDADRAQFLLNQSRVVGSQIGSSQSNA